MGLIKEFKEFAMRGNVVDMAVGIIIGGAFGKIVTSLVGDVIMPIVGSLTAGKNFTDLFLWFGEADSKPSSIAAARESGGAFLGWGSFLQTTIDFLIIALAIFLMIKLMNAAKARFEKEEEGAEPADSAEVALLKEIRDALKNQS